MPATYTTIFLHIVLSTKHRKPFLTDPLRKRLYHYMGGIIKKEHGKRYEIGGMPDHVHILLRWRPDVSISDFLRTLKSCSLYWVHKTVPKYRHFGWQDGYAAFSVSQSQIRKVKRYIASQEEHHKKRDFQQELKALLKAHDVEYDERYI